MRLLIAALLLGSAASAQEGDPMPVDAAALKPVLDRSWATGPSCEAGLVDYAIDTDGQLYQRSDQSFTPLVNATLDGPAFTTIDEVGLGRTTSLYTLASDGTLRLMSEIYDPNFGEPPQTGPDAEPITQRVKDGLIVIDEEGKAQTGVATPALKPCPRREALFTAEIITALEGTWATGDGKGGICANDADSINFQLTRPVPHVLRGPFGGEVTSSAYALKIFKDGAAFVVTEGNAFEASDYAFTPDAKGGLTQANPYADGPLELHRCP